MDRLEFRTPYYLQNADGKNEFVVCEMCGCSAPKSAWQNKRSKR